jgi:predicted transcriptional regulator
MSDDWRTKAGGYRPSLDAQGKPIPRARGGVPTPGSRPGQYQIPENDLKAAARAIYEGIPGATCVSVAKETGAPEGTVRRWKAEGKWKPAKRAIQNLSARAGELANSFQTKMSELGKPISDDVAADEAARELSETFAVDVRAQLLDRHRKEWAAPRKIIYEAAQKNDLDKAKLGKIVAETLMLVQTGECRAYGIDQNARGAGVGDTVVVIDRGGQRQGQIEAPDTAGAMSDGVEPEETF